MGVAIALVSGLAEVAGVGGGTFGWKQVVGVAVGVAIALAGLYVVAALLDGRALVDALPGAVVARVVVAGIVPAPEPPPATITSPSIPMALWLPIGQYISYLPAF